MTVYVARNPGFSHVLRDGKMVSVALSNGTVERSVSEQPVWLYFKQGILTAADAEYAVGEFRRLYGKDALGSVADERNGIASDPDALEDDPNRGMYSGVPPMAYISSFDSDRCADYGIPPEITKEEVEASLEANMDFYDRNPGAARFIKMTMVTAAKPWAKYPEFDEECDPERVVSIAEAIGVSLLELLTYEELHSNRAPLVAEIQARLEELKAEQEGDKSLAGTVT